MPTVPYAESPAAQYSVELDEALAVEFLKAWHGGLGGDPIIGIFALPSRGTVFSALSTVIEATEGSGLDELVYPSASGASGIPQTVYHSVGVLKRVPARGRGKAADYAAHPGLWVDLDVKDGAFGSQSAIHEFIWTEMRDLKPNIVVNSGGGGCHLYWSVAGGVDAGDSRELVRRMQLLVRERSGLGVDDVSDATRVLRLPGTAWFKRSHSQVTASAKVTMQWCDPLVGGGGGAGNGGLDLGELAEATDDLWTAWKKDRQKLRSAFFAKEQEAQERWVGPLVIDLESGGNVFAQAALMERAREEFPRMVSWEAILEPAGWVKSGPPDDEGHQEWTRPCAPGEKVNPRSLVTGWIGSPDVASLLSDSERTGLQRLSRAGVALTKLNVAAELWFQGSTTEALGQFIARQREAKVEH